MTTHLDQDALENLVRQAMGAGVACFAEKARAGEVDLMAPLSDAFGDFPAEFLRIRSSIVDALLVEAS